MSDAEYELLISGAKLMNINRHRDSGRRTNSVGFCFFTEDPDEAIHWLRGIVRLDWCVTLDFPDKMLKKSYGVYRDPDKDPYKEGMGFFEAIFMPCPSMRKTEYCTTNYSLSDGVRILSATQKYAGTGIISLT